MRRYLRHPPLLAGQRTSETSDESHLSHSFPVKNKLTRCRLLVQALSELVADLSSSVYHQVRYEKRLIC